MKCKPFKALVPRNKQKRLFGGVPCRSAWGKISSSAGLVNWEGALAGFLEQGNERLGKAGAAPCG